MTYSKTFKEGKYLPIASLLERMQSLEDGESIHVPCGSAPEVNRLRFLVYDWLAQQGLKKFFRIFTKASSVEIRKQKAVFEDFEVKRIPLSPRLEEILKELLTFDQEKDVLSHFQHDYFDLDKTEVDRIIKEWRRIMQ